LKVGNANFIRYKGDNPNSSTVIVRFITLLSVMTVVSSTYFNLSVLKIARYYGMAMSVCTKDTLVQVGYGQSKPL